MGSAIASAIIPLTALIEGQGKMLASLQATLGFVLKAQEPVSKLVATRRKQAFNTLPKVTVFLNSDADVQKIQEYAKAGTGIISFLQSLEYPFNEIVAWIPTLERHRKVIELYIFNLDAQRALLNQSTADSLVSRLGLSPRSFAKRETYWVWVQSTPIDHQVCRDHSANQSQWKESTGLAIRYADYKCNQLLWGFDAVGSAEAACRAYFLFSGAIGWAM
jgi:hypothetical protein